MNKTLMKDIFIAILVLGLIALIAGGVLGLVYSFTKVTEAEEMQRLTDKISASGVYAGDAKLAKLEFEGFSQNYENGAIINVFKTGDAKAIGEKDTYVIHCSGKGGYSNNSFELLVNITDNKIVKIASYTNGETPGVGSRAFKEDMLSQFYDKNLKEVSKIIGRKSSTKIHTEDDENVAMVTGASKSSTALINAVNIAVDWYLNYTKGGVQ